MSAEVEEKVTDVQLDGPIMESSKRPARSYSRDFLLSFSELEVCKKLPDGFDASLLSEINDASHGIQDRQRPLGSSSLQGFRRTDYSSSPPTRGDSGGFSRGLNRWDSRSSVRSDTDSDSESGRRYGGQTRRYGQSPEHDGLLGSGSFPRPSGYAAGASAPRFRPNGNFNLSKSNEPYHPPRPFKAAPHSRREANDSFNDETFGSADSTSEDRAEEEKKRRAEFELMRKEQHKVLQEKQKSKSGKLEDPFSNITGLLDNPSEGKLSSESDKVLKQAPQDDSAKLSVPSAAPPVRPLVPPGFVSSGVDKGSVAKSVAHDDQLEMDTSEILFNAGQVRKVELEDNHQDKKSIEKERGTNDLLFETSGPSAFMPDKVLDLPSFLQAADPVKASSLPDLNGVLENGETITLGSEVSADKIMGQPGRSTSILEKLFGNALPATGGGTSDLVEDDNSKTEDSWSPNTLQSKFSRWFLEEDKKPLGDTRPDKPKNLLSLIVGGEKTGVDVSDVTAMGPTLAPETMLGHLTSNSASSPAVVEQFASSGVPNVKPAVLTCEDLEQSILSEVGGNKSVSEPAGKENFGLDVKAGQPGASIDNSASQHLLSLLQRGTEPKAAVSVSVAEEKSPDKLYDQEVGKIDQIDFSISSGDAAGLPGSGKTLTLEALFGTAFMNELHSVQGTSMGTARTDVSEPPGLSSLTSDAATFPSAVNEVRNGSGSHDGNTSASNNGISKMDKLGHLLGLDDPGKEMNIVKPSAKIDSIFGGFDGGSEVRLPEEDSLINLGDPIHAHNYMMLNSRSTGQELLSSSSNVVEKLGAAFHDERSMIGGQQDPLLLRGPYDMPKPDLPYHHLHPQASSPQHHAPQMNHGKPLFHPLESLPSHFDPHLKFMPPEAIIHRDAPVHHQFPGSMGHPPLQHHNSSLPGFDPIPPPILQQMHMAGNLPPPHLARGFSGGAPMAPHPGHNPSGYGQEHNPMQGFPFGQRQPNFGGPGMAPPGPEMIGGANNPPEAFQRLLEMELRANPKQMQPLVGGHSRAMYGHELDMGFRYR